MPTVTRVLFALCLVLLVLGCGGSGSITQLGGTTGGSGAFHLRWKNGNAGSMIYGGLYEIELYQGDTLIPDPDMEIATSSNGPLRMASALDGKLIYSLAPSETTGRVFVFVGDTLVVNQPLTIHPGGTYECEVRLKDQSGQPVPNAIVAFQFDNLLTTNEQAIVHSDVNGRATFALPQNTARLFVYAPPLRHAMVGAQMYSLDAWPWIPVTPPGPGEQQTIDVTLLP